jgi:NADPH-dependent ferric siderophore reductase
VQRQETHPRSSNSFEFPLPPRLLTIPGVVPLELEVTEAVDLGPRMRRIRLAGRGLDDFTCQPGQDVMLLLGGGERPFSRRYSIRRFDPRTKTLELNVVAHGLHGPGAQWASSTQPGDRINGVGPRGKILLDPDADWHLFVGDDTAAAAGLSMLEALPSAVPALAFFEVATAEDELATSIDNGSAHKVSWFHRGDTPATASNLLVEALNSAELPPGRGHVYIAGEVQVVAAVQRAALARGLAPEQLSPKAYWGRGKSNASNGEPDKAEREAFGIS